MDRLTSAALASLDVGVETGQVVIVALAVPSLLGAGERQPVMVCAASGAIAPLAGYWLLAHDRAADRRSDNGRALRQQA